MFREKMHTSNLHNILNKWSLVRKYLTVENFTLCSIVSNRSEVIFKRSSNLYAQLDLGVC